MMPFDALSGSEEAPTIAMTVASVSSCLSSSSLGFVWAIIRAYTVRLQRGSPSGQIPTRWLTTSAPEGPQEDREHRCERRELTEPEQQRPAQHVDAETARLVADNRESFDERDTDRRISVDDVLAQIGLQLAARGSEPRLEPFGCRVERTGMSGVQRVHLLARRRAAEPSTKLRTHVDDSHRYPRSSL